LPPGGKASESAYRTQELLASLALVGRSPYGRVKPLFDYAVGVFLALALLPFLLFTALAVRLSSPGPILYSQTRLGRFGRPFRIVKFRSMRHNAEKKSGAVWATRNDSRVTPIGKLLRITHLDELPQLMNILRGDMSLIGPRPERPEFIPALEATVENYRLRMLLKPGVTGMAQVYLPPDTDVASVRRKVIYDLYYIRHLSLWLDLRLLVATPLQAMGFPCPLVRFFLLLPSMAKVEREAMLPADFEPHPLPAPIAPPKQEPYILSDSKFGTGCAV
jgi:lipopolysaccharide/colanic/teichoic acid biosynthesis glycosyltransferase